jgi:hypothetical protein
MWVIDIDSSIDIYIDIKAAPIPRPPASGPERPCADSRSKPERAKSNKWSSMRKEKSFISVRHSSHAIKLCEMIAGVRVRPKISCT